MAPSHHPLRPPRVVATACAALAFALTVGGLAACADSGPTSKKGEDKPAPAAARAVEPVPFGEMNGKEEYNASGIVPLADSHFLICDNNVGDALFEFTLGPDGRKTGALVRRPLQGLGPDAIDDLEDLALAEENGQRFVFAASSLYAKKASKAKVEVPPSGLIRVRVNADGTLAAENLAGFRDWLVAAYPQLATSARAEPDDGGLNVEGLAWDPGRHAVLVGVRTPVVDGKPLVLPVKIKELAGPWTAANLEALAPIRLAVEGGPDEQGIRGLSRDAARGVFLVLLGNATSDSKAPFTLWEWDGGDGALRRVDVAFGKKMKAEGVTRGAVGGKSALVFVDDGGGYQILWD